MKHTFKYTLHNGIYNVECKHCKQDYKFKVTTQCPKGKLCDDIAKRVQSGQIDFVDGSWVSLKPIQEEAKPEVTVADSLSSLFEFMEAMVPELSPETSDELTDEDIDLLKNINSDPLPVSYVSKLELPVEQLVSLHKLKRLDYVYLFSQVKQYRINEKGEEFLKPKPVTLNAEQTTLLLSIATDEEPWSIGDVMECNVLSEMKSLYDLGLVSVQSNNHLITEAGLNHVNKSLALTV